MRVIAFIFFAIGLYLFLRLMDMAFQIIPLKVYGAEGGLIEVGMDTVFGFGASLIALLFAYLHFRRFRGAKGAQWLLGSCYLLVLGFLAVLIYTFAKYGITHSA